MQNKQTILLAGATGFLGGHLLEALLKNNYQVVILKRSTSEIGHVNHFIELVKSYINNMVAAFLFTLEKEKSLFDWQPIVTKQECTRKMIDWVAHQDD